MVRTAQSNKSVQAVESALQQLNHATVQEVMDWVNRSAPGKKVSLTSVYRALNQLVGQSLVKPLNFNDGQVRYELNNSHMHHHHFICTACNQVQVVDLCPFEGMAEKLKDMFSIHYHNFELFGLCRACQDKAS